MSMCALTAVVVSQFFVADLSCSAITCAYACDDGPVPLSVRILIPSSKRCPPGYPAHFASMPHEDDTAPSTWDSAATSPLTETPYASD